MAAARASSSSRTRRRQAGQAPPGLPTQRNRARLQPRGRGAGAGPEGLRIREDCVDLPLLPRGPGDPDLVWVAKQQVVPISSSVNRPSPVRRAISACTVSLDSTSFGVGDLPFLECGIVLTENHTEPSSACAYRSMGHLLDPAVQICDVLDDRGVDRRAAVGRRLRVRQQCDLGAERLVVHVAAEDDLLDTTGRMQRVRDRCWAADVGLPRSTRSPSGATGSHWCVRRIP